MARPLLIPNPENASIEELKKIARIGTGETALRCTAIQMLLAGLSRENVRKALIVTERSLREWIKAFNEMGIDGIIANKRPGRPHIIGKDKAVDLVELFENPDKADREFWTAKAFHGYVIVNCELECSYETIVRFFHREGFALKVPRPWSDRQDESLRQAFRDSLKELCQQDDLDIWFADESGFEGDPRPRRRWDRKGAKTRSTHNGDHLRMNVVGMVCPRTGEFFAIEATHVCADMFQAFLDEADKCLKLRRKSNVLILDNATWHKKKTLDWHGFSPMYLPPYSPDLNPIERIWLIMKARWFNNIVCKDLTSLIARLDTAILDLIAKPEQVKSTASIGTDL